MAQVIVFKNPYGSNVAVCYPTGEVPIEQVLAKDCPPGAFIVDEADLPQGEDATTYFEAWELIDGKVAVNAQRKAEFDAYKASHP